MVGKSKVLTFEDAYEMLFERYGTEFRLGIVLYPCPTCKRVERRYTLNKGQYLLNEHQHETLEGLLALALTGKDAPPVTTHAFEDLRDADDAAESIGVKTAGTGCLIPERNGKVL